MNRFGTNSLRIFICEYLAESLAAKGRDHPEQLSDDCDLLLSGIIDSLGLLDLITAFEDYCGRELDFDAMDPEQMTIVGPLCDFVAAQMAKE
ncbi:MAG: acyl carrier protein [Candidatus Binataceae bacterium]